MNGLDPTLRDDARTGTPTSEPGERLRATHHLDDLQEEKRYRGFEATSVPARQYTNEPASRSPS
jgi:hypothetical protein